MHGRWNVKASGAGFVTRFEVNAAYLARFQMQTVGGAVHTEYWIPAEQLPEFNSNIVGLIEVIEEFRAARCRRRRLYLWRSRFLTTPLVNRCSPRMTYRM